MDGHLHSHFLQVIQVYGSKCNACSHRVVLLANDCAPGVYDQRVAIALPPVIVLASLSSSNDIRLTLYSTCLEQQLPVSFTWQGKEAGSLFL